MTEPIPVRVRECPDGTHPGGDEVYLAPKLSLDGGLAATFDIQRAGTDEGELFRRWLHTFVRFGAIGWNFHDETGPIPFDVSVLLADAELGVPVANKGTELYLETLVGPLGASSRRTSRRGPTDGLTSPTKPSTRKRPASSSRRSTAGTPSRNGR